MFIPGHELLTCAWPVFDRYSSPLPVGLTGFGEALAVHREVFMTVIIDNNDPGRRPDAPSPPGLNRSPPPSDSVVYQGPLQVSRGSPGWWGEFPNEVYVTIFR